jgi:hypothetical protein
MTTTAGQVKAEPAARPIRPITGARRAGNRWRKQRRGSSRIARYQVGAMRPHGCGSVLSLPAIDAPDAFESVAGLRRLGSFA